MPVLLIGFNRPHCIKKIMQQLSKVKPQKLYVSIDGPRCSKPNEAELVEEVKSIVKCVNWECETHYRFLESNCGAEINVSSAIKWVLEDSDCVIVNEDDIFAGYSFYWFVQQMLLKYKDEERIGLVSGLNLKKFQSKDRDYYFSRSGHIWGWGTWKRVWDKFDLNGVIEDDVISIDNLANYTVTPRQAQRIHKIFKTKQTEGVGNVTWDYMFWYYRIKYNYLGIVPSHSLVTNIGVDGLHAKGLALTHFTKYDDSFHTEQNREIKWDKDYDAFGITDSLHLRIYHRIADYFRLQFLRHFVYNQKFIDSFYKD